MYIITMIVCLFYLFIFSKWDEHIREKRIKRNEQTKELERIFKKLDDDLDKIGRDIFGKDYASGKISKPSKPKYRMKEVDEDEDLLYLTSSGDFDEAFKL